MVHGARDTYSIVLNQASRFLEWTATRPELAAGADRRADAAAGDGAARHARRGAGRVAGVRRAARRAHRRAAPRPGGLDRASGCSRSPSTPTPDARCTRRCARRCGRRSTCCAAPTPRPPLQDVMSPADIAHVGHAVIERASQLLTMPQRRPADPRARRPAPRPDPPPAAARSRSSTSRASRLGRSASVRSSAPRSSTWPG